MHVADRTGAVTPLRAPGSRSLRSVGGGILALATAMGIGRFAYTPLLPSMQSAAHLSAAGAGFLASANFAGYVAGALVLTLVAPGAARGRLLAGSLLTVALTTGLMATTSSFAAWSVIRTLCGVASAAVFILASDAVLGVLR